MGLTRRISALRYNPRTGDAYGPGERGERPSAGADAARSGPEEGQPGLQPPDVSRGALDGSWSMAWRASGVTGGLTM